MSIVDVAITVENDRTTDETIVSAVKACGFTVERVFPQLRAIYGHGPAEAMERLASIEGVARIREAGRVQLAPMNPRIPQ